MRTLFELQRAQIVPRLGDQRADALDRVDLVGKVRQHRGLVAAAGAYLEHAMQMAAGPQQLGHAGDDVRLRNGLSGTDRQRAESS